MKHFLLTFLFLMCLGCSNKISRAEVSKLNGYWEIESVKNPDGEVKDYTVNTSVDYIELKDGKGYRQKMIQKMEGKFQSNGIKESLNLKSDNNRLILECKTNYAQWTEEIRSITDDHFSIINDQDFIYTYKRYQPLAITHE